MRADGDRHIGGVHDGELLVTRQSRIAQGVRIAGK